ncbi:hypothetical protein KSP40_PGU022178 [Platanthera guangdongensis]|uniref:Uncharacterized protein n=1 Tax=Platanthera guangdongensis TaxID=2320717 RepID=A0ABR2LRF2_9ASPA
MQVEAKRVLASDGPLFGFSGERKEVEGGVGLHFTLGGQSRNCKFVIVDAPSSYSAIFGSPLISAFRCVPSSFHQCLKFNAEGVQVRVRGDPKVARECYVTAVNTISWQEGAEEMGRRMEEDEQEAGEEKPRTKDCAEKAERGGMEEVVEVRAAGGEMEVEVRFPEEGDAEGWGEQSRLEAAEEVVELEVLTRGGRMERIRVSGG